MKKGKKKSPEANSGGGKKKKGWNRSTWGEIRPCFETKSVGGGRKKKSRNSGNKIPAEEKGRKEIREKKSLFFSCQGKKERETGSGPFGRERGKKKKEVSNACCPKDREKEGKKRRRMGVTRTLVPQFGPGEGRVGGGPSLVRGREGGSSFQVKQEGKKRKDPDRISR